jgi:organic radical activating enzyme
MFGENPVRHSEVREDGKLQVHNIFYTLQGEGPFAGDPSVFIRLSGCNLRCSFCDTQWDDENDPYLTVDEIYDRVAAEYDHYKIKPSPKLIIITGGEPLRQDLSRLFHRLSWLSGKVTFQIETAGTLWQDCLLREDVYIVCSPKTPKINESIWNNASAFKYVIRNGLTDQEDGLPLMNTQIAYAEPVKLARPRPGARVYLSPCDEIGFPELTKANEKEVVRLALKHGYTAGLQLHKIWNVE